MIRKYCINKFNIATACLILICILSITPYNKLNKNIDVEISESNSVIYLVDKDDYVSKLSIFIDKNDIKDIIKEKLIILRDGSVEYANFKTIIPKDTIINKIEVKEDNVYIDFSKELKENTDYENMIEAIVYSLTEINGINNIYITIENKDINEIYSNYTNPLTRKIGINKEYDINNLKDITMTTVFFVKEIDDNKYYVPVTKINNSSEEKISIIINELKSSIYSVNNLESYISNELLLDNFNKAEDTMNLVFNDYIFESIGSNIILEEVKYTIGQSIVENYGVKEVIFSTKDNTNITSYVSN